MMTGLPCIVLVLELVGIVLAREVPFMASDRQGGCSGVGQRCELSSQPCCPDLHCKLRDNPDEDYVDETEGECISAAAAAVAVVLSQTGAGASGAGVAGAGSMNTTPAPKLISCLAEGKRCYSVGASCCEPLKCAHVEHPDDEYVDDDTTYCSRD